VQRIALRVAKLQHKACRIVLGKAGHTIVCT
jgi:hypothetical protein